MTAPTVSRSINLVAHFRAFWGCAAGSRKPAKSTLSPAAHARRKRARKTARRSRMQNMRTGR